MLKCLKIEQLFGRFDYTIELQKTPITILTGPNGFGKSTILKIIDAISATNILFFYKLSFKKITVTFTDDSIFSMEQKERNGKLPDLYINGERFPVDIIVSNRIHIPWLHRVSPGEWIDFRTREKITRDQIVFHIFDSDDSVQDVLEFSEISAKDAKKYSGIIQNTKSAAQKCGNVRLISEQRLIRKERDEDDDEQIVDVISQLPKKMRAKISELTANYTVHTQIFESLRWLSLFRKIDANEGFHLNFKSISIAKAFKKQDRSLDISILLAQLCDANREFFYTHRDCLSIVTQEMQKSVDSEQLILDTRGHDCLEMFHCLCKPKAGKDCFNGTSILTALICAFDFSQSKLYHDLSDYGCRHNLRIVI